MTMRTSYFRTSLVKANFQMTSGRHVDHSMDAACDYRLYRKEICAEPELAYAARSARQVEFFDSRLSKVGPFRSTKIQRRFTIVSREMAAN
jgi:hypothetical protein